MAPPFFGILGSNVQGLGLRALRYDPTSKVQGLRTP
jgi:hypothetical protein